MNETIALRGHGTIEIHDAFTGDLISCESYTNVITDYTREQIIGAFTGAAVGVGITHVAIGSSATPASADQTALIAEVYRATPTSVINYNSVSIGFKLFISASMLNGDTLREIGLFDDGTAGNMMARSVSFTPVLKSSAIIVTFTHILTYV